MHVRGYDLLVEEAADPINQKASILLSRNHPIALVVGAAGFLGSHLVDQLLSLNIQVLGVDDLSTGRKENLSQAFKNRGFHFIGSSIAEKQINNYMEELPRLDYAYFMAENPVSSVLYRLGLENFLQLIIEHKKGNTNKTDRPKIVFVSSIELYDSQASSNLNFLKTAESEFARFVRQHQLNARIVRLAEVFGPRMHFRHKQSFSRLIRACLEKKLIQEQTEVDFSSRGLFVDDAVNLLIKAALAGSTTGKIYDGCLNQPLKVAEIKQILLDPVWHRHRGFLPTQLPPWPTPNLNRTLKELSWKPKAEIIQALKNTLDYFEQDESAQKFALQSSPSESQSKLKVPGWSFEEFDHPEERLNKKPKKRGGWSHLPKAFFIVLVFLGLVLPAANFALGSFYLPQNLTNAKQSLEAGELEQAKKNLVLARVNLGQMKSLSNFFIVFKSSTFWDDQLSKITQYVDGEEYLVTGGELLTEALQKQTAGSATLSISQNNNQFIQAEQNLSQSLANLSDPKLGQFKFIPNIEKSLDLSNVKYFYQLSQKGSRVNSLLPQLFPKTDSKSYLIVLTNNSYPTQIGGELLAVAKLNWGEGKILISDSLPINVLDQRLTSKGSLFVKKGTQSIPLQFNSSSSQANFPSFAQLFSTLYRNITDEVVDGVFLIDTQGMLNLQTTIESSLNEQTKALIESKSASSSAEIASQFQTFAQSLSNLEPNKTLKVAKVLGEQLDQKHLILYSTNPKVLNLLRSQGWVAELTGSENEQGSEDFLQVNQSYISGPSAKAIKRKFSLQTQINNSGGVTQKLKLDQQNTEAQSYQALLQFYLPLGTRLTNATINGQNLMSKFTSLVEYGRAVYISEIVIPANSLVNLEFSYALSGQIKASKNISSYSLKLSKQPESAADPLEWSLTVPEGWQVTSKSESLSNLNGNIGSVTDLSQDRKFELTFKKP